jgi:putative heme iron utilization protein
MAANQEPERLAAAVNLLLTARSGVLATLHEGMPHASLVTPGLDDEGQPVLLLSDLAAHTSHLRANPACALLVTGAAQTENPQTAPRLCLRGEAKATTAARVRERFLRIHPYAAQYVDFGDFNFWTIVVAQVQYIGGFANASHLDVAALQHEICARLRDA